MYRRILIPAVLAAALTLTPGTASAHHVDVTCVAPATWSITNSEADKAMTFQTNQGHIGAIPAGGTVTVPYSGTELTVYGYWPATDTHNTNTGSGSCLSDQSTTSTTAAPTTSTTTATSSTVPVEQTTTSIPTSTVPPTSSTTQPSTTVAGTSTVPASSTTTPEQTTTAPTTSSSVASTSTTSEPQPSTAPTTSPAPSSVPPGPSSTTPPTLPATGPNSHRMFTAGIALIATGALTLTANRRRNG